MAEILRFPDRNLLKLIDAVNGVIAGDGTPEKALSLAETVMRDMGAVKGADGSWSLPKAFTHHPRRHTVQYGSGESHCDCGYVSDRGGVE